MPTIILMGILALLVLVVVFMYNRLVTRRVRCNEAWSDIDTQLKRRYDLIPNLVEAVKGYAAHEKEVFTKVTEARAAAMQNQGSPAEQAKTENVLAGALKSLFAVSENYPDLKANQNFLQLQEELTDTENKIQAARRFYNTQTRDYNTVIETFPSKLIANMFKFEKRTFFELEDEKEREAVQVKF
ncbi:MAG: LemA family protein [Candidatus Gracilibacteria bacterium]|nr:LemA family protein [Candidatus Gracilibacteria bacterium]